jgi:hypothetical protein
MGADLPWNGCAWISRRGLIYLSRTYKRRWGGGRYKYQQVVIGYIIEEFGFDQKAIVPIPLIVSSHYVVMG